VCLYQLGERIRFARKVILRNSLHICRLTILSFPLCASRGLVSEGNTMLLTHTYEASNFPDFIKKRDVRYAHNTLLYVNVHTL